MICKLRCANIKLMKSQVISSILLCLMVFGFFNASFVYAKKLPSKSAKKTTKQAPKRGGSGVVVSAKLRSDRKAVNVYFANLNLAQSVSYTLSYQTDGKQEGVGGSIDPKGVYSTSRELVFGTASGGVYRYHSNISGAKLEIITNLKSGKKSIKRFKIKV